VVDDEDNEVADETGIDDEVATLDEVAQDQNLRLAQETKEGKNDQITQNLVSGQALALVAANQKTNPRDLDLVARVAVDRGEIKYLKISTLLGKNVVVRYIF